MQKGDKRCVDCGLEPPKTETNYTLVSQQHGWRLTRTKTDEGFVTTLRCPACWAKFKASGGKLR
jgi:uncharacterized C2H2 Zn-finger protein